MTTTTTNKLLFFEGVGATEAEWRAVNATIYGSGPSNYEVGNLDSHDRELYSLFLRACAAVEKEHKEYGRLVIAWMLNERQRISEERTRSTANARLADANARLAGAIEHLAELAPQLGDRFQSTVRQLGETIKRWS